MHGRDACTVDWATVSMSAPFRPLVNALVPQFSTKAVLDFVQGTRRQPFRPESSITQSGWCDPIHPQTSTYEHSNLMSPDLVPCTTNGMQGSGNLCGLLWSYATRYVPQGRE